MNDKIRKYKQINRFFSIISSICCYAGAIYMIVILFCQYNDNRDSSQASMKRFNESPTGRYPSLTFCIYAKNGKMFKEEVLKKVLGLRKDAYYQLLTGDRNLSNLDLTQIKFNDMMFGIEDFLEEVVVEDNSYQTYNHWSPRMKDMAGPALHQRYQDPRTNCFTYNTEYSQSVSLNSMKIKFNITKFQHLLDHAGKIYILAHYPGVLIRDMKMFLMKVSHWENLKPENSNNQIQIELTGVTLMRFRATAAEKCDPELVDDDAKWKQRVIQTVGCVPPYWNNINVSHRDGKGICNTKKELSIMKSYWPIDGGHLVNPIFDTYTRPCNKMILFNTILKDYEDDPELLKIKIRMKEEFYQEILNTRGFSMADLWASIGGYVGVFLGFSIHQATANLIDIVKRWLMS